MEAEPSVDLVLLYTLWIQELLILVLFWSYFHMIHWFDDKRSRESAAKKFGCILKWKQQLMALLLKKQQYGVF